MHKIVSFIILLLALSACGRNIQNEEAVRKGVIAHLAKRSDLNLNALNIQIASLNFRENEADALVSIQLKGGEAGQSMQMRYTLERKGNDWVVKDRKEAGEAPHSGMAPQAPDSGGDLPPGHPPIKQ